MRRFAVFAVAVFLAGPLAADPAQWQREGWKTDFAQATVDLSEIVSVIPRDRIPSIDMPRFVPVSEVDDLPGREPVIELVLDGAARAYPIRIMMWHEIVNDRFGDRPVAVTYCPLCNATIVFEAEIGGERLEFGTSGKLRHSDLVMYDRASESWWQQFSGEAIAGVHAGRTLKMLPARMVSWERFRAEHRDGTVLVPNNPQMRQYWANPYAGYDTATSPFLYRGALPEGIPPMEYVVMVRGETPFAVALALLAEKGEIREGDIIVRWEPGQASALDAVAIAEGRDVGNVTAVRTVGGREEPIVFDVTFAFVVNAFEPTLPIRWE